MPDAGKRLWAYDKKARGLALQVTAAGSKSFYVVRKVQGKAEFIRLGAYPDLTVAQARRRTEGINGEIAKGNNPAELRREKRREWDMETLFTDYLDGYAKVHKRSWREDKAQFDRYLSVFRARKVSAIKRNELKALHATIGQDSGVYAANRLLALLRKLFNYAMRERDIALLGNPALGIKPFKEEKRERWLAAEELPAFFQAVAEEPNTDIRDYVILSLVTGARRANVLGMTWEEIDLSRAVWTISAAKFKAGKAHTIPLPPPPRH